VWQLQFDWAGLASLSLTTRAYTRKRRASALRYAHGKKTSTRRPRTT